MNNIFQKYRLNLLMVLVVLFSGCSSQQKGTKSSVVDYLYPKESAKVIAPSIPLLKLPIKLGIAFVPEQAARSHGANFWGNDRDISSALTEAKKMHILEKVSSHFKKYSFVGETQEIPSTYLTPGGSFANLEQIKTMYGIDVIALVSYDQVQFTDAGLLSISYWTIVGAYIVSGEKNDTNTLMDTVVYDIASKKMLFRAPGTSIVKGRSTPVNLSEELRADSAKGFELATNVMIANLDIQLAGFREKAKQNPEQIKVIRASGGTGGGAIDLLFLGMLALFFCIKLNLLNTRRVPGNNGISSH
ncbi:MAG: rhombotarget lipoprotein [Pseudomonadota bacterium]